MGGTVLLKNDIDDRKPLKGYEDHAAVVLHPASWQSVGASSANTELDHEAKAGEAGKRHYITHISVGFIGASTGEVVQINLFSGATQIWFATVPSGAGQALVISQNFTHPLECAEGEAVNVTVSAAGDSCIAYVNVAGFTV